MRTPLQFNETERIRKALIKRWSHRLRDERFEVSGWMEKTTVQVTIVLHTPDNSFHYPMEARVDPRGENLEPIEGRDLALDFLDWYLGEFFDSGRELLLPVDWSPHEFAEHEVFARGQVRNLKLEQAADDLLEGRASADGLDPRTGEPKH